MASVTTDVIASRLPVAEAEAVREHARKTGVPVSALIRRALHRELTTETRRLSIP